MDPRVKACRGSRVMIKWRQEAATPGQRDWQLPQYFLDRWGSTSREEPEDFAPWLTPKHAHLGTLGGGWAGPGGPSLTYERFDGAVDVLVLLEARGGGRRSSRSLGRGVGPGAPTVLKRMMCRCRLLGSVNTWGTHRLRRVTALSVAPVDPRSGHGMGSLWGLCPPP